MFVCWEHQSELATANFPQRLGVRACFNRPCDLRAVAWPQPAEVAGAGEEPPASHRLTSQLGSAFSPRFSQDGASLVFLSQQAALASGVHSATVSLHSLSWGDARGVLAGGMAPLARTGALAVAAGWTQAAGKLPAVLWPCMLFRSSSAEPGCWVLPSARRPFIPITRMHSHPPALSSGGRGVGAGQSR